MGNCHWHVPIKSYKQYYYYHWYVPIKSYEHYYYYYHEANNYYFCHFYVFRLIYLSKAKSIYFTCIHAYMPKLEVNMRTSTKSIHTFFWLFLQLFCFYQWNFLYLCLFGRTYNTYTLYPYLQHVIIHNKPHISTFSCITFLS